MLSGLRRFIGNWGILVIGVVAIFAFIGVAAYLGPCNAASRKQRVQ